MADEGQYGSAGDASGGNRKYEDTQQLSSPPRRSATGFSEPIATPDSRAGAPAAYNNVPPPPDEFQLAKQRAQEIAARLFNSASIDDAKRTRVENGSGGGCDSGVGGYSSGQTDYGNRGYGSGAPAAAAAPRSYGGYYSGSGKKIEIPNGRVGVIIGKGGETIKYVQFQSGAKIQVQKNADADLHSSTRLVELTGTPDQVEKAKQLMQDVLKEAEVGGSGTVNRRFDGGPGGEQFSMQIPNNKVGLVIGKGGETIKSMQAQTGARIQVIPLHLPPGDPTTERRLQIDGTSEQIEQAKQLVFEVISENRSRNTGMGGGYSQGYQGRPQSDWGQGAPPVQPNYGGYGQPGAPPAQYNMPQASYGGYPPHPPASGYAANWDPSAANKGQQGTQGGGYDYYSQQNPQQPQDDNTAYNYNQQPTFGYGQQGQGYAHGGGYQTQPAYGQPQSGYEQQQGYNSGTYGGGVANSAQEGQNAAYDAQANGSQASPSSQQGYSTNQQLTAASYASQWAPPQPNNIAPPSSGYAGQPGPRPSYGQSYGTPQGHQPLCNPPAYVQPQQQSPNTRGGYAQAGYTLCGDLIQEILIKLLEAAEKHKQLNRRMMITDKPTRAMKQNTAAVSSNESSKLLLCGDLIREILLKLPIKTLLRFKQVSKTWLRMITSSSFISHHYSAAKNRQSGPSFFIVRIPINICDRDRDRVVSVITQISMEASRIRIDNNLPLRFPYPIMFTAGFGLYCMFESWSQRVVLWNPGTRKLKLLPPSPFRDRIHSDNLFCFGHVDYKDDGGFFYKVGLLSQRKVENSNSVLVHRLELYSSSTDSWKLILTPEGSCCGWMANGVNLNGKYHILSYGYESSDDDDDDDDYAYNEYDCHIMTFDYSTEVFGRIELPDLLRKASGRSNLMIDSFLTLDDDIFLCLVVQWKNKQAVSDDEDEQVSDDDQLDEEVNHEEFLDVWVMREYGVKESWSKEFTVGPISRGTQILGYWKNAGGFFLRDHYKLYICNSASFAVERLHYVYLDEMCHVQVLERKVESLVPI